MDPRSRLPELRRDRRTLGILLLLLLLMIVGAGIGTLSTGTPPSGSQGPGLPTITVTPATPTPLPPVTPNGSGGDGTATPPTDAPPATPPSTDRSPSPPEDDDPLVDDDAGGGGAGGGDGSPATDTTVSVEIVGTNGFVSYADAKPGDAGSERIVVRNVGDRDARVLVPGLSVTDDENGLVEPELPVDGSPDVGELSANVDVTLRLVYPNGSSVALYGTGSGSRSLAALAAEPGPAEGPALAPGADVEVVLEWSIPADVGNEIQSDELTFEIPFELRATGS